MIKKNLIRIFIIIIIIISIFNNLCVFAYEKVDIKIARVSLDPTEDPNSWKPVIGSEPELTQKAGNVLGIINLIGIVLSVIIIAAIGIKYMLGSVEEKADYKKAMIPYIVGAFLLAFATTIPNIIYTFVQGAIN